MGAITGIGTLDEKDKTVYAAYTPPPPPKILPDISEATKDNSLQGVTVAQNSSGDTYQHTTQLVTGLYSGGSKKVHSADGT